MPIWLRKITYQFIIDSITDENEAQNKALNKSNGNVTKIDPADLQQARNQLPSQYIKASKK